MLQSLAGHVERGAVAVEFSKVDDEAPVIASGFGD
jgi:type III secretion system FlhB-like substrate exporter